MKRVLFVCSQNRLRSPTAEQIFSTYPGLDVASAGLNHDAESPLTNEMVAWADIIFVMERAHRHKLQQRFRAAMRGKRIVCLEIPDKYEFMDPSLVGLLRAKVPRHLPSGLG
ncbi:protein tyrosine phosphatase [Parasulfuritortus cantonensis]|uniref:Protein tyrosine phosphatase n=1 Tax=Parasulfuritortus cantonensis TaxID=2528202 RepID=A0A4R1B8Z6_9PROT|nr:low molecular weight protein tyrosine phosphatase family protein [Parasulfuritortus cantonensis]TCJ12819.1 protein tyrosine phosphatase [Parasulfuritortus cantonensis]